MSQNNYKNNSEVTPEKLEAAYKKYMSCKDYAPTGCLLLDLAVGGGEGLGFPYGWMVNVVGDKSAGKTFLAWEIMAANFYKYKKHFKWNYDAAEAGNSFQTEKLYGVDLIEHERHFNRTSDLVEEMDGNTSLFLDQIRTLKQRGIYCVDSLDGLSDKAKESINDELKKEAAGGKAKEGGSYNVGTASHLSKQYFRTKAGKIAQKKALLLIISQVRENLNAGQFGKKVYRAGGKAMDFYAHTCLWLYGVTKIEREGKVVGAVVRAKTEKSKTPRPYRECNFTVYFDYGVDNIGSCIDYLYDLRGKDGKLTKKANSIPWGGDGEPRTFKGTTKWLKEEEPELYTSLKELKKEDTGKANLSESWLQEQEETNKEYKEKLLAKFGETVTRDELIEIIEESDKQYKLLEKRVIFKWEAEEIAARSNRKRKYS